MSIAICIRCEKPDLPSGHFCVPLSWDKKEREQLTQGELGEKHYKLAKEAAVRDLTYPHDGPVTKFSLISRAIKLARKGKHPTPEGLVDDPVANALFELLDLDNEVVVEGSGA